MSPKIFFLYTTDMLSSSREQLQLYIARACWIVALQRPQFALQLLVCLSACSPWNRCSLHRHISVVCEDYIKITATIAIVTHRWIKSLAQSAQKIELIHWPFIYISDNSSPSEQCGSNVSSTRLLAWRKSRERC